MDAVDDVTGRLAYTLTRQIAEVQQGYTAFAENDVLFAKITPCMENGKAAIARRLVNSVGFGSTEFHVLRASEETLPEWIFYFVRKKSTRELAEQFMTGSAGQRRVPASFLSEVSIPKPDLKVQKVLIERLERADRLRRLRQYALTISDQYLQNVFLEMFGDPETNPKGWEISTLDDMDADFRYGTSKKSDYPPVGVPVLRIPNVLNRHIDLSDLKYSQLDAGEERRLTLQRGDILFVRTNGNPDYVGRCTVFDSDEKFVYASYLIRARIASEEINPWFLEAFLQHQEGRKKMLPFIRTTAGQSNISVEGLGQIPVPRPPLELQQQYALVVQKHERLRRMQVEALRQAEQLYETLLEEAFGNQN
ncbi:type-1 restriction enzyme EcoKI specificity protein [Deinococcus xinjiangensis]|uniref:Type-1 restriction enzyme EcoKI specificity protein n=2 Tax=Deinococcus xinjiangensis TaxID=457454 RepID=A0ABP9VGG9_9DEIO